MSDPPLPLPHLVLVGAGHAHIQLLRMHLMQPFAARITLVTDRPEAVYSGMVPGVVSGQYTPDQVELDAWPLARKAGVRVIVAPAERVDAQAKRVHPQGRPPLPYDICSIDIGSTVRGRELPGVIEHSLPTRPISLFVSLIEQRIPTLPQAPQVVVVGGGAAGIELAFCIQSRLLGRGLEPRVTLLDAGARLLPHKSQSIAHEIEAAAQERGVVVRHGVRVAEVQADAVVLEDGESLPCDCCLWVTGAQAHPLAQRSALPTERGFVQVQDTLQVVGHPELFAVGDCAHMVDNPWVPKAGVYAVRAGPALAYNLRAKLGGERLKPFVPQRDFLTLLNLGDGTAIGYKWGRVLRGPRIFQLKDRIDLGFMEKFRVLSVDGRPEQAFARDMPPMPEEEMICGGCAAKLGADPLSLALAELAPVDDTQVILGLQAADDAAALQRPTEVVVQSVDVFTAFMDEPFVVGQVAASNSLSDLHATGVHPRIALALVNLPKDGNEVDTLRQVMAGVRAHLDAEGCTLVGGHTTLGDTLSVGLSVTGFVPTADALWRNASLAAGDRLILTRPLGTGVLFHADMAGKVRGVHALEALAWMRRGNGPAARALQRLCAQGLKCAVTDVTGFGLAGHLIEMLRQRDLAAHLSAADVPALPGTLWLLEQGERSTFHGQNRDHLLKVIRAELAGPRLELLFDPQTAGGLIVGVREADVTGVLAALVQAGDVQAAVIGRVVERGGGERLRVA